ncbi:MAG TPA: Uma2 family endonuclease [Pyrinomonadaceae bacterium]|nr:Uma2 family endonuclease [Pyrinomonadaceae bacterium]
MNIATADTVIPIPFMADTRSVRLHFDFEDQKRKMTPDEFWEFCAKNRKIRAELTKDGDVIIMPPTGFESSEKSIEIGSQLLNWAKKDGNGKVTDSNGAYVLPSGATYAPDAAWVKKDRLKHFTPEQMKKFLPLAPDFVIELRSESDSLDDSKAKMAEWIENGVQLGWFIDPQNKQVHIYRPDRDVRILDDPAAVSGDDILPGFELDLSEVW